MRDGQPVPLWVQVLAAPIQLVGAFAGGLLLVVLGHALTSGHLYSDDMQAALVGLVLAAGGVVSTRKAYPGRVEPLVVLLGLTLIGAAVMGVMVAAYQPVTAG
jgi:hypothetical protein